MTVEQGICASFLLELHQAVHDFTTDTFKIALFDSTVDLSPDTTAYSATGEASGTGYTAGGEALVFTDSTPKLVGRLPIVNIDPVIWTGSFSFRGILLYNSSKSDRAWMVIDPGRTVSISAETYTVPPNVINGIEAIYRLAQAG